MSEITIPYHLAVPTAISLLGILALFVFRKRLFVKRRLLWSCLTLLLILYFLIVGGALYESIYCQWDLNRYDLNQDGNFSGAELTNAQNEAMKRRISDTGRNFAFITGFVFSAVISVVVYIFARVVLYLKKTGKDHHHVKN